MAILFNVLGREDTKLNTVLSFLPPTLKVQRPLSTWCTECVTMLGEITVF